MRIGLAYNQRPQPNGIDEPTTDRYVEWDDPNTIAAVEEALRVFGEVIRLEAIGDFPTRLAEARVDLLFNMAEGSSGPNREAHVPAIAEFLGVPYTASDPLTLGLALHKGRAKEVFLQRGIPTPPFVLVESELDLPLLDGAVYPAFVKPAWEGSSKGISLDSYVQTPDEARRRALEMVERYGQPVLVEAYLPGEEFTVAILGNGRDAVCLPTIRYDFSGLPSGAIPIMGYEAKWVWDRKDSPLDILECPARIDSALDGELQVAPPSRRIALWVAATGDASISGSTPAAYPTFWRSTLCPGLSPIPQRTAVFRARLRQPA
ncbi:MAG: hypothetical protein KatS3mg081_1482 [Gemmatimonadales bacterium]|nr:MAG: hypothetical protein KatS3mg081_1482 [Gemmatimonadales bacterium]